jgi:ABC-type nitrate/sulfonate/bicarbonate transport system substrate-binding protein
MRRQIIMTPFAQTIYFFLAIFVLAAPWGISAQDKPLKKINWGVTSLSGGNWIPWIAKEARIYEKHGLDVQLILLRGSGQTSAALLGGSIFASPVALPTVMLADLSGADLINVAHTVPGVQTKMLVKPEIKRVEDLRGKRIATSSLGSLGDFLFKYILRKHGLDPNREITWLSMGAPPERLQALFSGVVDATEASYPYDLQGERKGFRILFDARKEVVYPSMFHRDTKKKYPGRPGHRDAHGQSACRRNRILQEQQRFRHQGAEQAVEDHGPGNAGELL